jgi:hypothetical protein
MLRTTLAATAALIVCASTIPAEAQLPVTTLQALQPSGGKAGTTFDVSVVAAVDGELADRLIFAHPGIKAVAKTEPSVLFSGKQDVVPGKFTVTVAADVAPGIYDVRLAGPLGVSNPRGFAIDGWNEAIKAGGNRPAEKAQPLEIGTVVNGAFEANNEDWYKFTAKKGARVVIDLQAQRLDSKADGTLVVYDAAGRELGRSRDANRRDPLVDLAVPADGEYFVKAYDFVFAGGAEYYYRLAVHSGAYIDFVFPPVVRPGEKNKLTVYGRNLPGGSTSDVLVAGRPLDRLDVTVEVPADEPTDRRAAPAPVRAAEALVDAREYRLKTSSGKSNAVLLGYARAPVVVEAEPNDALEKTQIVKLPCEVVGQFLTRGDLDSYQFEAKKGDVVAIEVISQRMGYSTDPWLLVQQVVKNKEGTPELKDLKEVDDETVNIGLTAFNTAAGDPNFRLTAPEDGVYRVVVRDLYGDSRGDARLVYRLVLRKPQPDFRLIALPVPIAKGQNNNSGQAYKPLGTLIRSGEVGTISVMASRIDGYDGPIKVGLEGLPKGVTASEAILGSRGDMTPLAIVVPEKTPEWQGTVRVVGRATIDGREVTREARGAAIIAPGANNRPAEARMTHEIPLSIGGNDVMPCTITLGDGKPVTGSPGAKVEIPVKIVRRNGFKDAVQLTPVGLPSYAKASQNNGVTVADKEVKLTIDLDKGAPLGELTFAVSGVIPRYNYALDKATVEAANKRKDEAAKAAADVAKAVDEAKKKAAALPKEKKAEGDKTVADATEKAKQADAAKKAVEAQAAAVAKLGQSKSIQNVPVVSTLVTLKITEPEKKDEKKK